MAVVGDGKGKVGWGYGKANEVPPCVEKATKQASRTMQEVPIVDGSIPHVVKGRYGAAKVILIPAGRYRYHRGCFGTCGLRSGRNYKHLDEEFWKSECRYSGESNDRSALNQLRRNKFRVCEGGIVMKIHDVNEDITPNREENDSEEGVAPGMEKRPVRPQGAPVTCGLLPAGNLQVA